DEGVYQNRNVCTYIAYYKVRFNFRAFVSTNFCTTSSVGAAISLWICSRVSPFKRSSPMVFLKYVFNRRRHEKDLSADAVVTGNVASN
uniref:Uncharacterized protein n=1 Tax=Ciona intestinalis TaxID=7719 RepID=H2XYJ0_CIOIN